MLKEIRILNFGVVEDATIFLSQGLSVLTGETGAGKTMVIHALNQSLGSRSDLDLIRDAADKLQVESRWDINSAVTDLLAQQEIDIENDEIVLAKTLDRNGKSRVTINGYATNASVVSNIGEELIQIFGQNDQRLLAKASWQLASLDSLGSSSHAKDLASFNLSFNNLLELKLKLHNLKNQAGSIAANRSRIAAELAEFDTLKPEIDEDIYLKSRIEALESSEEVKAIYLEIGNLLDDDSSVSLTRALRQFAKLIHGKPEFKFVDDAISDFQVQINTLDSKVASFLSDHNDSDSVDELNSRRAGILNLIRKHATPLNDLIKIMDANRDILNESEDFTIQIDQLGMQIQKLEEDVISQADQIRLSRTKLAHKLESAVTDELAALKMSDSKFHCLIEDIENATPLEIDGIRISNSGKDVVQFYLSHGIDGVRKPISKTASGGELSRIMLAIQVVLNSNQNDQVFIFDEVDAGIGGETAIEVGKRLAKLSEQNQVIVVTHLPQVAAFADHHFMVTGNIAAGIKISDLKKLNDTEREQEIARMLGGMKSSDSAVQHARELLALKGF
jgi:DNA repair protein RecN (Recombination protein N)